VRTQSDAAYVREHPGRLCPWRRPAFSMNIGVLGVVPWQEAAKSESIASLVLERTWGKAAAGLLAFLGWTRNEREWPFGPERIHEEFRPAGNHSPTEIARAVG
jgi:hypothetical protein